MVWHHTTLWQTDRQTVWQQVPRVKISLYKADATFRARKLIITDSNSSKLLRHTHVTDQRQSSTCHEPTRENTTNITSDNMFHQRCNRRTDGRLNSPEHKAVTGRLTHAAHTHTHCRIPHIPCIPG